MRNQLVIITRDRAIVVLGLTWKGLVIIFPIQDYVVFIDNGYGILFFYYFFCLSTISCIHKSIRLIKQIPFSMHKRVIIEKEIVYFGAHLGSAQTFFDIYFRNLLSASLTDQSSLFGGRTPRITLC